MRRSKGFLTPAYFGPLWITTDAKYEGLRSWVFYDAFHICWTGDIIETFISLVILDWFEKKWFQGRCEFFYLRVINTTLKRISNIISRLKMKLDQISIYILQMNWSCLYIVCAIIFNKKIIFVFAYYIVLLIEHCWTKITRFFEDFFNHNSMGILVYNHITDFKSLLIILKAWFNRLRNSTDSKVIDLLLIH